MKVILFPVGSNELIDRSRFVSFKLGGVASRFQPTVGLLLNTFIAVGLSLELTDEPRMKSMLARLKLDESRSIGEFG